MEEEQFSLAERYDNAPAPQADSAVMIDAIKSALADGSAQGEARQQSVERLLRHALDTRDAEATALVTRAMDEDAALDEHLNAMLAEALETQPDAVYAFIRSRLSASAAEGDDQQERWVRRLRTAAEAALQVAINDGDTETVNNWLKLIAREPATYGLNHVLHQGILAAQERAHEDGELGRQLILLAAKRDPEALDFLLNDDDLLAILPGYVGQALRDYQGDALALLQNRGSEIFLMALARAAQIGASALFTPQCIAQLWAFLPEPPLPNLPEAYQAQSIVQQMVAHGAQWLDNSALEALLTLILSEKRDDLFQQMMVDLSRHRNFLPIVFVGFRDSHRSATDTALLIGQMVSAGWMEAAQVIELDLNLLNAREWRKETLPLMEQAARTLQQYPALSIPTEDLWRLLEKADELRSDVIARPISKRILLHIENVEDEKQLTERLARLYDLLDWHNPLRQHMMTWWRGFNRSQNLNRLQKIEKALDGRRSLEEAREITHTVIAFRKMLGKRSLKEFSEEIDAALAILQNMAEAFDPDPKRALNFDQAALRAEVDLQDETLSPSARKIFANNLKEMAQIVGQMGDNRSKANLMRRGENIDRQLMTGEQQPDSAVDLMKWLAGYLEGSQDKDGEGEG